MNLKNQEAKLKRVRRFSMFFLSPLLSLLKNKPLKINDFKGLKVVPHGLEPWTP